MTRAEELLNQARETIKETKTKSFEEWLKNISFPYDNNFKETVLKSQYENNKNNIVSIRTTKKTMSEIQTLADIEILKHSGTYYSVKVSA